MKTGRDILVRPLAGPEAILARQRSLPDGRGSDRSRARKQAISRYVSSPTYSSATIRTAPYGRGSERGRIQSRDRRKRSGRIRDRIYETEYLVIGVHQR